MKVKYKNSNGLINIQLVVIAIVMAASMTLCLVLIGIKLMGGDKFVALYENNSWKIISTSGEASAREEGIASDNDGNVWVAAGAFGGGLFRLNLAEGKWTQYSRNNSPDDVDELHPFYSTWTRDVAIGRSAVWVATAVGVYRYADSKWQGFSARSGREILEVMNEACGKYDVNCIDSARNGGGISDSEGAYKLATFGDSLWVALDDGAVSHYDGARWSLYSAEEVFGQNLNEQSEDAVKNITVSENEVWLSTNGFGIRYFDGTKWTEYKLPVEIITGGQEGHGQEEQAMIATELLRSARVMHANKRLWIPLTTKIVVLDLQDNSFETIYESDEPLSEITFREGRILFVERNVAVSISTLSKSVEKVYMEMPAIVDLISTYYKKENANISIDHYLAVPVKEHGVLLVGEFSDSTSLAIRARKYLLQNRFIILLPIILGMGLSAFLFLLLTASGKRKTASLNARTNHTLAHALPPPGQLRQIEVSQPESRIGRHLLNTLFHYALSIGGMSFILFYNSLYLLLAIGITLLLILPIAKIFLTYWALAPTSCGDEKKAQKRIRLLDRLYLLPSKDFFGHVLIYSGRFEEAAAFFYGELTRAGSARQMYNPLTLVAYGDALYYMGRVEDALKLCELASDITPMQLSGIRELHARALLTAGIDDVHALTLTEQYYKQRQGIIYKLLTDRNSYIQALALYCWALAKNKNHSKSLEIEAQILPRMPLKHSFTTAMTYLYLAHASHCRGNKDNAWKLLEKAISVFPDGPIAKYIATSKCLGLK